MNTNSDFGTKESHAQNKIALQNFDEEGTAKKRAWNLTGTPLDFYKNSKLITEEQYKMGLKLARDFFYSGLSPRLTAIYDRRIDGSRKPESMTLTERAIFHRKRFEKTLQAVGPVLSPILWHVCCDEGMAGDWALKNGKSASERGAKTIGLVTLQLALDQLRHIFKEA